MALTLEQGIYVRLSLRGGPQYNTGMNQATASTERFGRATTAAGVKAEATGKKMTFMQQQAVFMARRGLFYGTLGIVGMGAALAKLGFHYQSTMNTASVALQGFIKNPKVVQKEMDTLYKQAAASPFQFPDIVLGARRLFAFNHSLKQTNADMTGIINGLSAAGFTSASSLNRATLAFAHMYAIGHLNGQSLLQMNRDNLQMTQALMWYYHATGDVIKKDVSAGLISAQDAAKAFNAYMQTPGFRKAAFNQATKTLTGAWSTFKDLLGMGAGQAEGGMFDRIRKGLAGVDEQLMKLSNNGRKFSLTQVAQAIDHVISPHTHAFINVFNLLKWTLVTVIFEILLLTKAVQGFLQYSGIDYLAQIFHINHAAAVIFGAILGTLITLFIIERSAALLAALALDVYRLSELGAAAGGKILAGSMAILDVLFGAESGVGLLGKLKKWAFLMKTTKRNPVWAKDGFKAEQEFANSGILGKLTRGFFNLFNPKGIGGFRNSIKSIFLTFRQEGLMAGLRAIGVQLGILSVTAEGTAFSFAALWAAMWPVLALTVIAGLVILYFKWKAFHDLVNRTATWIYQNANKVAAALITMGGPIGLMLGETLLLIKHFQQLKRMAVDTAHAITNAWNKVKLGGVTSFLAKSALGIPSAPPGVHSPHSILGMHLPHIPTWAKYAGLAFGGFFQEGGRVPGPVGSPALAVVHGGEQVIPVGGLQGGGGGGGGQPIIVQLVVDRKVLAQAVARANQDYAARR